MKAGGVSGFGHAIEDVGDILEPMSLVALEKALISKTTRSKR
jgi:hypothetical protein